MPTAFAYRFRHELPARELKDTLLLAVIACQALHGAAAVRLDAGYTFHAKSRCCVVSASTRVGRDLNRLFAGLAQAEFGADGFRVEPVDRVDRAGRAGRPHDRCKPIAR